jgi:hypothetical protein
VSDQGPRRVTVGILVPLGHVAVARRRAALQPRCSRRAHSLKIQRKNSESVHIRLVPKRPTGSQKQSFSLPLPLVVFLWFAYFYL